MIKDKVLWEAPCMNCGNPVKIVVGVFGGITTWCHHCGKLLIVEN